MLLYHYLKEENTLSYLIKIIKEQSINNIHFVPSMLTVFIDEIQETGQQKN